MQTDAQMRNGFLALRAQRNHRIENPVLHTKVEIRPAVADCDHCVPGILITGNAYWLPLIGKLHCICDYLVHKQGNVFCRAHNQYWGF